MKTLDRSARTAHLGLAYGPGIMEFMSAHPGLVDYIEMPFEQLRHVPGLATLQETAPILLHCASLSVAGFIPPSCTTVDALKVESERTQTPWIGEHLAFVSADGINEEADRDTTPTNLTYTLCPQLSEETIDRVAENLRTLRPQFSMPVILENSPQYFDVPGSTMDMVDFIRGVVDRCDVDLLLDLSHLMITAMNTRTDPVQAVDRLPLERVVEIHLSGLKLQDGVVWDDHAVPAPPEMFTLLERVMTRARPRALTMEYNWTALPTSVLVSHIRRANAILGRA